MNHTQYLIKKIEHTDQGQTETWIDLVTVLLELGALQETRMPQRPIPIVKVEYDGWNDPVAERAENKWEGDDEMYLNGY